jgi:broad specificity phosphatase PhoE
MSRPLTTIYIVRHGESEANVAMAAKLPNLDFKNWDPDLTELGVQQAQEKFEAFKHITFDLVFASDLLRAKKTAEIIAAERELAVMTRVILRESNRSSYYYGQPDQQQRMNTLLETLSHEQQLEYREADMESYSQAATRLITFIREVALLNPGKTVLIVAHGTIMRSFLIKIGFATLAQLPPKQSIDNTAHVQLETDGIDFFVKDTQGVHKRD